MRHTSTAKDVHEWEEEGGGEGEGRYTYKDITTFHKKWAGYICKMQQLESLYFLHA